LAFHPYPQVIRAVFNPHRFGPPLGVTQASPCSWVDRPGFGSTPGNLVFRRRPLALLSGLAFARAPPQNGLTPELPRRNSPDHNAKGTQSGVSHAEAQDHPPTACRHVVSGSLSLPAQGCFSPVPHGTRPLSVTREYSEPWRVVPPASRPVSRVGRYLGSPLATVPRLRLRGSHPLRRPVPGHFSWLHHDRPWILQPRLHKGNGLGMVLHREDH
jgi:hypothetical protein